MVMTKRIIFIKPTNHLVIACLGLLAGLACIATVFQESALAACNSSTNIDVCVTSTKNIETKKRKDVFLDDACQKFKTGYAAKTDVQCASTSVCDLRGSGGNYPYASGCSSTDYKCTVRSVKNSIIQSNPGRYVSSTHFACKGESRCINDGSCGQSGKPKCQVKEVGYYAKYKNPTKYLSTSDSRCQTSTSDPDIEACDVNPNETGGKCVGGCKIVEVAMSIKNANPNRYKSKYDPACTYDPNIAPEDIETEMCDTNDNRSKKVRRSLYFANPKRYVPADSPICDEENTGAPDPFIQACNTYNGVLTVIPASDAVSPKYDRYDFSKCEPNLTSVCDVKMGKVVGVTTEQMKYDYEHRYFQNMVNNCHALPTGGSAPDSGSTPPPAPDPNQPRVEVTPFAEAAHLDATGNGVPHMNNPAWTTQPVTNPVIPAEIITAYPGQKVNLAYYLGAVATPVNGGNNDEYLIGYQLHDHENPFGDNRPQVISSDQDNVAYWRTSSLANPSFAEWVQESKEFTNLDSGKIFCRRVTWWLWKKLPNGQLEYAHKAGHSAHTLCVQVLAMPYSINAFGYTLLDGVRYENDHAPINIFPGQTVRFEGGFYLGLANWINPLGRDHLAIYQTGRGPSDSDFAQGFDLNPNQLSPANSCSIVGANYGPCHTINLSDSIPNNSQFGQLYTEDYTPSFADIGKTICRRVRGNFWFAGLFYGVGYGDLNDPTSNQVCVKVVKPSLILPVTHGSHVKLDHEPTGNAAHASTVYAKPGDNVTFTHAYDMTRWGDEHQTVVNYNFCSNPGANGVQPSTPFSGVCQSADFTSLQAFLPPGATKPVYVQQITGTFQEKVKLTNADIGKRICRRTGRAPSWNGVGTPPDFLNPNLIDTKLFWGNDHTNPIPAWGYGNEVCVEVVAGYRLEPTVSTFDGQYGGLKVSPGETISVLGHIKYQGSTTVKNPEWMMYSYVINPCLNRPQDVCYLKDFITNETVSLWDASKYWQNPMAGQAPTTQTRSLEELRYSLDPAYAHYFRLVNNPTKPATIHSFNILGQSNAIINWLGTDSAHNNNTFQINPINPNDWNTPNQIKVPDNLVVGSQFCIGLTVREQCSNDYCENRPVDAQYLHSVPLCAMVTKTPTAQIHGGGLLVQQGEVKGEARNYKAPNCFGGGANCQYGSWIEYDIIARGQIQGVTSNAGTLINHHNRDYYPLWHQLSFANIVKSNSTAKGMFVGATNTSLKHNQSQYAYRFFKSDAEARGVTVSPSGNAINLTTLSPTLQDGVNYLRFGGGTIEISGTLAAKKSLVVIQEGGNILVTGNTNYQPHNPDKPADISQLVLLAKDGNIIVDKSVTNLDAWLIALGNTRHQGIVNTCNGDYVKDECQLPLRINGHIMTDYLRLARSYGGALIDPDQANQDTRHLPAELINIRPDTNLWLIGQYHKYPGLVTSQTREKPPRF